MRRFGGDGARAQRAYSYSCGGDGQRPSVRAMERDDGVAGVLLIGAAGVAGWGCVATHGVLREYADVCSAASGLEQVWLGGAGLAPLVTVVVAGLAVAIAMSGGRRTAFAGAALLVLATVGATVSGIAGVAGKQAAYRDDPATYGSCLPGAEPDRS